MVDGREATWSCSLSVPLSSLAWVSARNMSSKSWSASMGTSTPWLGLVSIPLRRLAQAGTAVQIQPVWIVKTLSSQLAKRRGMANSLELKFSRGYANEF